MSGRSGWRTPLAVLCLVVLAISAPATVLAGWVNSMVSDTDRYVETVAPLADDPDVQDAVAERVTDAVSAKLKIRSLTDEAADALAGRGLPGRLADGIEALGDPLADSVAGYVHDHVLEMVRTPEFSTAWERANREAHTQLVLVLTGESDGTVRVEGDAVRLDLAVVIDAVRQRLLDDGFDLVDRLPEVTAEFTLVESADLEKAQAGFRLLTVVDRGLPLVVVLAAGGAVLLSRSRRGGIGAVGWVLAGSMLALGVVLDAVRLLYLDSLRASASEAAATVIFDQLVRFVRQALRSVLVLGLAVALGAWVVGPSKPAAALRRGANTWWATARRGRDAVGLSPGPVGRWVASYRPVLRGVVLVSAALFYVAAEHPTGERTLGLLVVTVAVLAVIELAAAAPVRSSSADDAA